MPLLFFERGMKDKNDTNCKKSRIMFDWICRRVYSVYVFHFKICVKERLD